MPEFEELPDDYDVATSKAEGQARPSAAARPSSRDAATPESSSAPPKGQGSLRGLQRGFFNQHQRPSKQPAAVAPAAAAAASASAASEKAAARGGSTSRTSNAEVPGKDAYGDASPGDNLALGLVDGLRQRLCTAVQACNDRSVGKAEDVAAVDALRDLDKAFRKLSPQARWPPNKTRNARVRANAEIQEALADLRSATGDSRRLRSGDERRAVAELKRAGEDLVERLRKTAESASAARSSPHARTHATVMSFRELPLTVKLRVLADEPSLAAALLGSSFLAGAVMVIGLQLELSSAWRCSLQCG